MLIVALLSLPDQSVDLMASLLLLPFLLWLIFEVCHRLLPTHGRQAVRTVYHPIPLCLVMCFSAWCAHTTVPCAPSCSKASKIPNQSICGAILYRFVVCCYEAKRKTDSVRVTTFWHLMMIDDSVSASHRIIDWLITYQCEWVRRVLLKNGPWVNGWDGGLKMFSRKPERSLSMRFSTTGAKAIVAWAKSDWSRSPNWWLVHQ